VGCFRPEVRSRNSSSPIEGIKLGPRYKNRAGENVKIDICARKEVIRAVVTTAYHKTYWPYSLVAGPRLVIPASPVTICFSKVQLYVRVPARYNIARSAGGDPCLRL
jgi:hypothetical protein